MKMLTVYVSEPLYKTYQMQAEKKGRKAAELIRDAMEKYAQTEFKSKKCLADLDFNSNVVLKSGSKDFLTDDSWRDDFFAGSLFSSETLGAKQ